jgi:hypothetical protein
MNPEIIDILDVDWDQPETAPIKQKIKNDNLNGKALAFVIETEVADTMALTEWYANLLLSVDSFEDGGNADNIYYVKFIKNNNIVNILKCNEMQHAILLSNPKIIDYAEYENGMSVCPGWSFIDNKFTIPGEV